MKHDSKLGKMFPVRSLMLKSSLQRYQEYVWYQDEIYLNEYRLVGPFQFGTKGRKILKYPDMIKVEHQKEF